MTWPTSRPLRKLLRERAAMAALAVILAFAALALFVRCGGLGALGADQATPIVTEPQEIAFYTGPSAESWQRWLGTDRQGRSILVRAVASIDVAMSVGLVAGVVAVLIGTMLGCVAGQARGRTDAAIVWLYSTIESIPYLLLLLVLSYSAAHVFGRGIITVHVAFAATFWTGPCRVIRGEVMRLREAEFVVAARAIGASPLRILLRHVVPNVAHLSFIYFSLVFIGAIKSEVILSFLGLGVQDQASWGIMIDQARAELATDFYWQIGAATAFMFVLVLAFNIFTDALQDALDPKAVKG
jgi:peptide/nickel transport system permease protein